MSCESLRFKIELYAESELQDLEAVASLERHLGSCRECRNYLLKYDELTAAYLAAEVIPGRSSRRVERICSALAALPRHTPPGCQPRLVLDVPAAQVGAPGRQIRWQRYRLPPLLATAAALFVVGITLGVLWSRQDRTSELASPAALLRLLDARSAIAEEVEGRDRRWVLDASALADFAARRPSERLLRLYGLDFFVGDAQTPEKSGFEVGQSGFVVDAAPRYGDGVTGSTRFYLVADDTASSSPEVIEIDPRSWFQARDLSAIRRQARQGKSTLYRVHAVPAPNPLRDLGFSPPIEVEPLPGSWRSKSREKDWVVPVRW